MLWLPSERRSPRIILSSKTILKIISQYKNQSATKKRGPNLVSKAGKVCVCVYVYIYIHIYIYLFIYIYMKDKGIFCLYIKHIVLFLFYKKHIYIYIYILSFLEEFGLLSFLAQF